VGDLDIRYREHEALVQIIYPEGGSLLENEISLRTNSFGFP